MSFNDRHWDLSLNSSTDRKGKKTDEQKEERREVGMVGKMYR